jgi:hypothetical protein
LDEAGVGLGSEDGVGDEEGIGTGLLDGRIGLALLDGIGDGSTLLDGIGEPFVWLYPINDG